MKISRPSYLPFTKSSHQHKNNKFSNAHFLNASANCRKGTTYYNDGHQQVITTTSARGLCPSIVRASQCQVMLNCMAYLLYLQYEFTEFTIYSHLINIQFVFFYINTQNLKYAFYCTYRYKNFFMHWIRFALLMMMMIVWWQFHYFTVNRPWRLSARSIPRHINFSSLTKYASSKFYSLPMSTYFVSEY